MKGLRAPRRAHPVDLDHDEAQLGQRLVVAARGAEAAATDAPGLRARVDVVDDRVLLRRVERLRRVHQAVQVGLSVARLDRDGRRRLPAGHEQARNVGLLQRRHQLPVGVAKHGDGRHVRLRISVHEPLAGRRE